MKKKELVSKFSAIIKTGRVNGWFGNLGGGPWVQKLERAFASYHGAKHAIAVSSGTAALHCALIASGVRPGDKVVTTAYTHIGGVSPILMCGAIPVFVDTEPRGFNMDPDEIREVMKEKPAAIIASHQLGYPCDMDRIIENSEDARVVEDASQALGARYKKRRVGAIGDIGIFSVGGDLTKPITSAEGGLIVTDDEQVAEKCRALRNHGDRYQEKMYLCYNYRMSDLQALVGYYFFRSVSYEIKWQMERGKYIIERAPSYLISLQEKREEVEPSYYILGFEVAGLEAERVVKVFEEAGISKNQPRTNISRGYKQLIYELPFYRKYTRPCPYSEEKTKKSIWVDYHRRPRSYAEIDRMLEVSRRIR